MEFYEQLRKENILDFGRKASDTLSLAANQYSDRTHFLFEILQNAEDAMASKIKFILYKDRFEIRHDGRPFNEKDVIGICGMMASTKTEDYIDEGTKIGHFGIGFKAVYAYTETPVIYSSNYHFRIEEYVKPYEVEADPNLDDLETKIVLPFNKASVPKEICYEEIHKGLKKKMNSDSLLILKNIREIHIVIDGTEEEINVDKEMRQKDGSGNVFDINIRTENVDGKKNEEDEKNYLLFTDAEKEAVTILFSVDGKEIKEIRNSLIYAYFPTAKESHQNFIIHAPFDTTPARDNLIAVTQAANRNKMFVKNLSRLIQFAFIWMKDNGYLNLDVLNKVYPIYKYDEEDLFYDIYVNCVDFIQSGERILPTNKEGVFKNIKEILVPESRSIVDVFDDEDMHSLLGDRELYWMAKDITSSRYSDFRDYLNANFKFRVCSWKELVVNLNAKFLKTKNVSWFENLFSSIENMCYKTANKSISIDALSIPFVRTSAGEQITAQKEGKYQVYLNNPEIAKYRIDSKFLDNDIVYNFYNRVLHIPEYNIEREVVDKILPKYLSGSVSFNTTNHIKENINDLATIKEALKNNIGLKEKIKEYYIVTDGNEWFRPEELHIKSTDVRTGYKLLSDLQDIKYLSNKYFDDTVLEVNLDDNFFKTLGCFEGLKKTEIDREHYLRLVRQYDGAGKMREIQTKILYKNYISNDYWNVYYDQFELLFKNMTKKKSKLIFEFLNAHTNDFLIKDRLLGADDRNYDGRNVDAMEIYSAVGLILSREKWIYKEDEDRTYSPEELNKEEIADEYSRYKRIIDVLPFKKDSELLVQSFKAFGIDIETSKQFIEMIMNDNGSQIKEMLQTYNKAKAKRDAKAKKESDLKSLLGQADKSQRDVYNDDTDFEVRSISERGLKKREANLEKEFLNSMKNEDYLGRGVVFTRRESNKEEKLFLESEYGGYCQICKTRIKKWNGDSYFEAINIVKANDLQEHMTKSFNLGWNSLSLCPNCAAKYNYCSKVISGLYYQVMQTQIEVDSDEPIEIKVEIPEGEEVVIKYSPRHFLALKRAFEIYAGE
ncbi:sacsin N-terminal ATP-binding-like domain-containing protein [Lachnospira multipara]|uniref:sacsin N-terminal ATP-binding-like domain-containing protein n=1 Tax=Lachnospira multipara TaxID=28051 RepID=UPI00040A232D|nr:ATP-binding protein [Lachnospira multipara]